MMRSRNKALAFAGGGLLALGALTGVALWSGTHDVNAAPVVQAPTVPIRSPAETRQLAAHARQLAQQVRTYSAQGRASLALARARECSSLALELGEGERELAANALIDLSNCAHAIGEDEEAIRAAERACALAQEIRAVDVECEAHFSAASSWLELGRQSERRVEAAHRRKAREHLQRAREITPVNARELRVAIALNLVETHDPESEQSERAQELGEAERLLGEHERELEARRMTSEELETLGLRREQVVAMQAWSALLERDYARARSFAIQARELAEKFCDDAERLNVLATLVRSEIGLKELDAAYTLHREGLDELEALQRAAQLTDAAGVRARSIEWLVIEDELLRLELELARDDAERTTRIEAGIVRLQRWKAATLAAQIDAHTDERAEVATDDLVARVRAALPDDDTCAIEFVNGFDETIAFVVTKHGPAMRVPLGPWRTLEALRREFHGAIESTEPSSKAELARAGSALHDALVAPVFTALETHGLRRPRRLVVAPTPGLGSIALEATLTEPLSGDAAAIPFAQWPFLQLQTRVEFVPSFHVLVQLAERAPRSSGESLTSIFAAPDNGSAVPTSLDRVERYPDLRFAREEARGLARVLLPSETSAERARLETFVRRDELRDGAVLGDRVQLFVGSAVTRAAFARLDARSRFVYVMTHAEADLDRPSETGLVLSFVNGEHERFTCADFAALRLDTELVVFSACRTGVGRVQRAEGTQSLAFAALAGGARGVISSRWLVDDRAGFQLFTERVGGRPSFHEAVTDGSKTPQRALDDAKSDWSRPVNGASVAQRGNSFAPPPVSTVRRSESADPYFWACFTYTGVVR